MKAAVWHGGRDIRIENLPKPTANYNEVVIRVKAVGICGSELHAYEGISKRRTPPLVMGHELAGVVEEIGEGVTRIGHGDRVTMEPAVPCGLCEQCLTGRMNLCKSRRHIGLDFQGAFAEYVKAPSQVLHKIPPSVSFEEATLAEPLSAGLHAMSIARIGDGDSVLIIGAGVIGMSCLIAARERAKTAIMSDIVDFRLEVARSLGADILIDSSKVDPVGEVERITNGRGVDIAIEAVGLEKTVGQAVSAVREGGRVTVVGMLDETIRVNIMKVVTREIQLSGSYGRTNEDFKNSLILLERRAPTIRRLITHKLDLDKASEAFEILSKMKHSSMKVVLIP
jgi:L-iditol 2-dehydrogenase